MNTPPVTSTNTTRSRQAIRGTRATSQRPKTRTRIDALRLVHHALGVKLALELGGDDVARTEAEALLEDLVVVDTHLHENSAATTERKR